MLKTKDTQNGGSRGAGGQGPAPQECGHKSLPSFGSTVLLQATWDMRDGDTVPPKTRTGIVKPMKVWAYFLYNR